MRQVGFEPTIGGLASFNIAVSETLVAHFIGPLCLTTSPLPQISYTIVIGTAGSHSREFLPERSDLHGYYTYFTSVANHL